MRALLKKLDWFLEEPISWLSTGDIPADPLGQLATKKNTLSVYEVNDDQYRIERVAAALAANRKDIDTIEYFTFDQSILERVGISLRDVKGDTCDEEVNSWHRDMIEISGNNLLTFAKQVVQIIPSDFVVKPRVRELIIDSLRTDRYVYSKVQLSSKDKLLEEAKRNH